jgi:hypothetical protein
MPKESKLIKKNFPSNSLKKVQSKVISAFKIPIYGLLVYYLIVIAYISAIINYLVNLRNCECYKDKNSENYSNLTYLIVIESILLGLSVLAVIALIPLIMILNKGSQSGGAGLYDYLRQGQLFFMLFYLVIYGLFLFYVFRLYENVNINCPCTQSWLRYLLYIQTLFIFIGVIMNVFAFFQ